MKRIELKLFYYLLNRYIDRQQAIVYSVNGVVCLMTKRDFDVRIVATRDLRKK